MIEIDFNKKIYVCPYCGCKQAFANNADWHTVGYHSGYAKQEPFFKLNNIEIVSIICTNSNCEKMTMVGVNNVLKKQWDLIPTNVHKQYPEYIPQQIRSDYEEASAILEYSPKAAATLFRRCLQGMIHDFWNIHEKNLNAEISELKNHVPSMQWKAIDAVRKVGNIGAHMEHDINCIVEIDPNEANKLQKLIELLIQQWYIARHEEEKLYNEIEQLSDEKEQQRNNNE